MSNKSSKDLIGYQDKVYVLRSSQTARALAKFVENDVRTRIFRRATRDFPQFRSHDFEWPIALADVADIATDNVVTDEKAVRGPLTAMALGMNNVRSFIPSSFVPIMFPEIKLIGRKVSEDEILVFLGSENDPECDLDSIAYENSIQDNRDVPDFIARIVHANKIITSSVYTGAIAESYGTPTAFVAFNPSDHFAIRDYLRSTGRSFAPVYNSVREALNSPSLEEPAINLKCSEILLNLVAGSNGNVGNYEDHWLSREERVTWLKEISNLGSAIFPECLLKQYEQYLAGIGNDLDSFEALVRQRLWFRPNARLVSDDPEIICLDYLVKDGGKDAYELSRKISTSPEARLYSSNAFDDYTILSFAVTWPNFVDYPTAFSLSAGEELLGNMILSVPKERQSVWDVDFAIPTEKLGFGDNLVSIRISVQTVGGKTHLINSIAEAAPWAAR